MKKNKKKILIFSKKHIKNTKIEEFLVNSLQTQKLQKTNSTVRATDIMISYDTETFTCLTQRDLGLLSKLKSYIIKNTKNHNLFYEHYNNFGKKLNTFCQLPNECHNFEQFFDTMEVDISSCYINTAYIYGVIDKDIYTQFSNLPKQKRLRLFGAIATKKTVCEYVDGNIILEKNVTPVPILSLAWAFIVNKTFEVFTTEIIPKLNSFQFFWVDAFFFHDKEETEKVVNEIKKLGYSSKSIELEYSFYLLDFLEYENKKHCTKRFIFKPKNISHEKYIFLPV